MLTVNPGLVTGLASPQAEAPPLGLDDLAFLECMDRTELGEIWIVRTPGGKVYQCQILPHHNPETTEALINRLQSFRHPNLVPWMAVHGKDSRRALLSVVEGPTLEDRLQETLAARHAGVPREELLGYLRQTALALDFLRARHQVQHLWLHPRQLVLKDDRVQILAFGLAETWWAQSKRPTADLNPRYSAPELLHKTRGPRCDQYSLALLFAEMVTGRHPWRSRESARNPDLTLLTQRDREIIQRALNVDPQQRFDSASEMIEALETATNLIIQPALLRSLASPPGLAEHQFPSLISSQTFYNFVKDLVNLAGGQTKTPGELQIRYTLDSSPFLRSQKRVGMATAKLPMIDAFCRAWHAKVIRKEGSFILLAIDAEPSVWQWLQGRRLGLEIALEFLPLAPGTQKPVVAVTVKPFGCDKEKAAQLLPQLGPTLLRSVREFLHALPEQRLRERLPLKERLHVCPVINGIPTDPIECITKDVSVGGIGFLLPKELPASQVYLNWPDLKSLAPYAALAQVVRKQPTGDGWFEVGTAFV